MAVDWLYIEGFEDNEVFILGGINIDDSEDDEGFTADGFNVDDSKDDEGFTVVGFNVFASEDNEGLTVNVVTKGNEVANVDAAENVGIGSTVCLWQLPLLIETSSMAKSPVKEVPVIPSNVT